MSFDWKEYVVLSEKLLEGTEESCFRSSVSRVYYGVLLTARDMKSLTTRGGGGHKKVIDAYKRSTNTIEQSIGSSLGRLKEERENANYEISPVDRQMAAQSVERAKEILTQLGMA